MFFWKIIANARVRRSHHTFRKRKKLSEIIQKFIF